MDVLSRDIRKYTAAMFKPSMPHAEADLLVRKAEAQGTELINRAMEGAGSDKLLRLRKGLALLNSIRGPIYISEDPTDLRTLGAQ